MMEIEKEFKLQYFSEVSVVVDISVESGYIKAECVHPSKRYRDRNVDLLPNWFHFSHGSGIDRYDNENDFEGDLHASTLIENTRSEAVIETLDKIANALWPGPAHLMNQRDIDGIDTSDEDELYQHFRHELLYAYFLGGYSVPHKIGKRHWIDEWVNYE